MEWLSTLLVLLVRSLKTSRPLGATCTPNVCGGISGADAITVTVLWPCGAVPLKITTLTWIVPFGPGLNVAPGENEQLAPAVIAGPLQLRVIVGLQLPNADTAKDTAAAGFPCTTSIVLLLGVPSAISTTRMVTAIA